MHNRRIVPHDEVADGPSVPINVIRLCCVIGQCLHEREAVIRREVADGLDV